MIAGAVTAAYLGAALVHRVPEHLLERIIFGLLIVVGAALIVEAFLPGEVPALLPDTLSVRLAATLLFGLGIRAVAGGFLVGLVPTSALKLVLGVVLIFSAAKIFPR